MKAGVLAVGAVISLIAVCPLQAAGKKAPRAAADFSKVAVSSAPARFKEFYVFCGEEKKNKFTLSGWMGDVPDIKAAPLFISDRADIGKLCVKIKYIPRGKKEWAGIYWLNPPNNWGTALGGYDLTGASYLTFWAKGEKGVENVFQFKIGGLVGKHPDSDAVWIGPVKLKNEWTKYKIDLKKKDLKYIGGGFSFMVRANDNPSGCAFYLADIKYVKSQ